MYMYICIYIYIERVLRVLLQNPKPFQNFNNQNFNKVCIAVWEEQVNQLTIGKNSVG